MGAGRGARAAVWGAKGFHSGTGNIRGSQRTGAESPNGGEGVVEGGWKTDIETLAPSSVAQKAATSWGGQRSVSLSWHLDPSSGGGGGAGENPRLCLGERTPADWRRWGHWGSCFWAIIVRGFFSFQLSKVFLRVSDTGTGARLQAFILGWALEDAKGPGL